MHSQGATEVRREGRGTMTRWNIAVVACRGLEDEAGAIRQRLAGSWHNHPEVEFTLVGQGQFDGSFPEHVDAVVLVADAESRHTPLVRLLTMLDELHVPVVALLDRAPPPGTIFETAGVLVEDRSASGPLLCAQLHGILHCRREVNRLRKAVTLAEAAHRGLGNEVARMSEELRLAAEAQCELLPREMPTVHGVSVTALWRPAHDVSGDIYDVIRLGDDHLGLFVADAVGHGITAALMTILITHSLTTRVAEGQSWRLLDPAEVLGCLNERLLGRHIHSHRFATAAYAVVDCRHRRMALATAGHPPPLLVHQDGSCDVIETSGGLLGVFDNETYDQVQVELRPDDRLLMYTDGVEQAFVGEGDGRLAGGAKARYREEFLSLSTFEDPQNMIDTIRRRLDAQSGSLHRVDDVTVLCLHAG